MRYRFVIETTDGKRFAARWCSSVLDASNDADQLVARRGLSVRRFVGYAQDKKKPGCDEQPG